MNTRNLNILLNAGIYLSLIGSVISLSRSWMTMIYIFLMLGLIFLLARSVSFVLEKLKKTGYGME